MSQRKERTDTSDLIRLGSLAMTMWGLAVTMRHTWCAGG